MCIFRHPPAIVAGVATASEGLASSLSLEVALCWNVSFGDTFLRILSMDGTEIFGPCGRSAIPSFESCAPHLYLSMLGVAAPRLTVYCAEEEWRGEGDGSRELHDVPEIRWTLIKMKHSRTAMT